MSRLAVLIYLSSLSSISSCSSILWIREYTPLIPPIIPRIRKRRNRFVEKCLSIHIPIAMHKKTEVNIVIPIWVTNDNILITGPYLCIDISSFLRNLFTKIIITFFTNANHHIFCFLSIFTKNNQRNWIFHQFFSGFFLLNSYLFFWIIFFIFVWSFHQFFISFLYSFITIFLWFFVFIAQIVSNMVDYFYMTSNE